MIFLKKLYKPPVPPVTILKPGQYKFNVVTPSKSSATAWKDDKMVRTLFGNVAKTAGQQVEWWDGKDDAGNNVLNGNYTIKGANSNLGATWQGPIGNTSTTKTGSTVHRGFERVKCISIAGNYMLLAIGYNEGRNSQMKVLLSNPQENLRAFANSVGANADQQSEEVTNDGTNAFWGGPDPFSSNKAVSFVYGSNILTNAEVLPSNGVSLTMTKGRTYPKAGSVITIPVNNYAALPGIGVANMIYITKDNGNRYTWVDNEVEGEGEVEGWYVASTGSTKITGLAVSGNFLFVARKGLNRIDVLNKSTFLTVQILTHSGANKLAADISGNLWIAGSGNAITKHAVNVDGTLAAASATINTGIVDVQGMTCNGNILVVADGGSSQQVKRFNSSGTPTTSFGLAGGYATNATVANNKLYFNDPANRINNSAIAYQSDGSWWVVDGGNYRLQKYNSSDVFQTRIQYMPHLWSGKAIKDGSTARVFMDYLECTDDPTEEDTTISWTHTKNWGYNVPANKDDEFKRLAFVCKHSNGRTIAFQKNGSGWELVELSDSGTMVFTGLLITAAHSQLYPGDKIRRQGASNTVTNAPVPFYERSILWNGSTYSLGAETSVLSPVKTATDPFYYGTREVGYSAGEMTSDGANITWDPNSDAYSSTGHHLGKFKNGQWVWKTMFSIASYFRGEFPTGPLFDKGNAVGNAGGRCFVIDDYIFVVYHGEFWKSWTGEPGQVNKVFVFNTDGIMIGQFGTTYWDVKPEGEAPAEMVGNGFYISIVKVGSDYYLYQNDESFHGGMSRWKITGFDTVKPWTTTVAITQPVPVVPSDRLNLLEGLKPGGVNMTNGNGWTISDTNYVTENESTNYWRIRTGLKTATKSEPQDMYIEFAGNTIREEEAERALPQETVESYILEGSLNYDRNYPNTIGGGNNRGHYFEILDISDKVIGRFAQEETLGGSFPIVVKGNGVNIVTAPESEIKRKLEHVLPFKITVNSSSVTFAYADYAPITTAILDGTADWTKPRKVRAKFFWNSGLYLPSKFGINTLYYSRTLGAPVTGPSGFKWSSEEMDFWVQRYLDGEPYNNKGDVKTNSPGDWAEIISSANQLLNNPYIDRYDGPTANLGTGGFVKANSTPEPFAKGARILDAAFAGRVIYQAGVKIADPARIEKGTAYINAAKTAILDQIGRAGVDFSNTTRWQNGKIGDANPGFGICEWVARILCAFDFVKSFCSSPQVTSFDAWLLNAATFWNNDLNHPSGVNQWFTNRDDPDRPDVLTLSAAGMGSGQAASYYGKKTHDGGYNIITFNTHWNNRRGSEFEMICYAGCYLNNDTFKQSAIWWVKDVLKYGVFANGMFADMERGWNGGTPSNAAGHEQGLDYSAGMSENFGDMADALARTGNKELFTYSTSAGLYGTDGGPKTLFKTMQVIKSAYTKIGWTVNGNLLEGENGTWKSDRIMGLLIANTYYYKDESINKAILRETTGMNPYPATRANPGPYRSSTGNGGQHSGKYFMYARPSLSLNFSPYPS